MSFVIRALPSEAFQYLFHLCPEDLARHLALKRVATHKPGFPCRVSLRDAEVGEEVILVNYKHQDAASPFQATHAVYARAGAVEAKPEVDEVPELFRSRIISLRAFDQTGMLIAADLADGKEMEAGVERLFENEDAAYLHAHFAKPGCYAARIDRAGTSRA